MRKKMKEMKEITMRKEQLKKLPSIGSGSKGLTAKLFAALFVGLLVLAGCDSHLESPRVENPRAGKGRFLLSIGEVTAGRTILPPMAAYSDIKKYVLAFTADGQTTVEDDRTNETIGNAVDLIAGTWNLTVTAYLDEEKTKPAAKGTLSDINITEGADVEGNVTLEAIANEGTGKFIWNIAYPSGVTEAQMTITPLDPDTGSTGQTLFFISADVNAMIVDKDNSARPTSLNTGYYSVEFSLTRDGRTTSRFEYLHVYQNLTSSYDYTFTDADFTDKTVTNFNLSAVTAPRTGATPQTGFTGIYGQYTGTIAWYASAGSSFDPLPSTGAGSVFAPSTVYKAIVTLTAQPGYTFDGVPANAFAYNNAPGASVSNEAGSGIVTIIFPQIEAELIPVTALDLTGTVTAPVTGATPQTSFDSSQYSGSIAWKKADDSSFAGNFIELVAYKAIVTLTAKSGYTFNGVAADAFSYSGATAVTNAANSGTVTITFPATEAAPVTDTIVTALNLTGLVTAPRTGATPQTAPIDGSQYTGSIVWKKADDSSFAGAFAPVTEYKATVTLTAKSGYTFNGVGANAFTYNGATAANAADSGVVTITFSATEAIPASFNVTTNGGPRVTTTELTLTFDKDIGELTAEDNITFTNRTDVTVDSVTRIGGAVYVLSISGFDRTKEEEVSVRKDGYDITGGIRRVMIYYAAPVVFSNVEADGGMRVATTKLTLTFDQNIDGLTKDDIVLSASSGISLLKGELTSTSTAGVYTLNLTASGNGTVSVTVGKDGYAISGGPKTAPVYYAESVTFNSLTADGGADIHATTGRLTLTFDKNITNLTVADITFTAGDTGATKGTLSRKQAVGEYELLINGVSGSGEVSVSVGKDGYNIANNSKTVNVYYQARGSEGIGVEFKPIVDGDGWQLSGWGSPDTIVMYKSGSDDLIMHEKNRVWRFSVQFDEGVSADDYSMEGSVDGNDGDTVYFEDYVYANPGDGRGDHRYFTLYASDYYTGGHFLTITLTKDGVPYNVTVPFRVLD